MTTTLTILLVIVLGFGVSGVIGAIGRTSGITHLRQSSGPLAVEAQSLYRSLSEADATEAGAFLSVGAEPPALRTRYLNDIASATEALTAISVANGDTADLRTIAAGLPTYTGLVETARANNRLGLPIGAAYLREASGQMRYVLLPAAQRLYANQSAQLGRDRDTAGGFPWFTIPLGLIALVGLVRAQRALTRRTHRVFNVGLVSATLIVAITLGWIAISWAADSSHLSGVAMESRRTNVIVSIRIDALNARADEALTLVARGADPRYDNDYTTVMARLDQNRGPFADALTAPVPPTVDADIRAAMTGLPLWETQDRAMRKANGSGQYPEAVAIIIGTGQYEAPALFSAVDTALGSAVDASNAAVDTDAGQADDAMTGLAVGVGLLTLIALTSLAIGFQRRIAEYR